MNRLNDNPRETIAVHVARRWWGNFFTLTDLQTFMKNIIMSLAAVAIVSALVAGCGVKSPGTSTEESGCQLTASELSMLMDFHAWKVRVPQSEQPFKRIRIVVVKPDGTVDQKFTTLDNLGPEPCSTILLGFRVEHGAFTGHFNTLDSKGGGLGWGLNFTDAFADSRPAWGEGLVWDHNRAKLAFSTSGEMHDSFLAIELVK